MSKRPKIWEDAHRTNTGWVGPPIVLPEDLWGADIVGLPATQPCQLGPGAHMWSDLVIANPWWLWFRSIRGVLACSCQIQCDGQADVYGMVGGWLGSGPFFACNAHWTWLGANHGISGGHSGAVLSAGRDRQWGGTSQSYVTPGRRNERDQTQNGADTRI